MTTNEKINQAVKLLASAATDLQTSNSLASIVLTNIATIAANVESRLWRGEK